MFQNHFFSLTSVSLSQKEVLLGVGTVTMKRYDTGSDTDETIRFFQRYFDTDTNTHKTIINSLICSFFRVLLHKSGRKRHVRKSTCWNFGCCSRVRHNQGVTDFFQRVPPLKLHTYLMQWWNIGYFYHYAGCIQWPVLYLTIRPVQFNFLSYRFFSNKNLGQTLKKKKKNQTSWLYRSNFRVKSGYVWPGQDISAVQVMKLMHPNYPFDKTSFLALPESVGCYHPLIFIHYYYFHKEFSHAFPLPLIFFSHSSIKTESTFQHCSTNY